MRSFLALVLASAGILFVSSCADETGPGISPAQIVSARILVNGSAAADGIRPTHGDMMRFEAQVSPASTSMVRRVVMDYASPPMARGRTIRHDAVMELYDN